MKNNEEVVVLLRKFIEKHDFTLSDIQIEQIILYIKLLLKWNNVYNLTNITDPKEILVRHVFESLAIIPYIKKDMKIIDVGTGAGIPGLILSIVSPNAKFYLCDIVDKKLKFLQQAIIQLNLTNCIIVPERIENYKVDFYFDIIISKAFAALDRFLELTKHLADLNTLFITFKSQGLSEEDVAKVSAEFKIDAIINQDVEQNDHTRKLVTLRKII